MLIAMAQQTAFQYDVLAVLYEFGPIHGLGAKKRLPGDVNHPTLYMNLNDLADAGYVEKSEADGRTNHYDLTHSGEVALRERVQQLGGEL